MINADKMVTALINKMLEKHNVDIEFVKKNPEIRGKPWYIYYTFTPQEEEIFEKWAIDFIKKSLKCSKERARHEYAWFNLAWGLHVERDGDSSNK